MRITITDNEHLQKACVLAEIEISDEVNPVLVERSIEAALANTLSLCEACSVWHLEFVEIDGECFCEACAVEKQKDLILRGHYRANTEGNDAR